MEVPIMTIVLLGYLGTLAYCVATHRKRLAARPRKIVVAPIVDLELMRSRWIASAGQHVRQAANAEPNTPSLVAAEAPASRVWQDALDYHKQQYGGL